MRRRLEAILKRAQKDHYPGALLGVSASAERCSHIPRGTAPSNHVDWPFTKREKELF